MRTGLHRTGPRSLGHRASARDLFELARNSALGLFEYFLDFFDFFRFFYASGSALT